MKQSLTRTALASVAAAAVAVGLVLTGASGAAAYQPSPGDVFTATDPSSCNKNPCVLYPKTAQLPSGRVLATFEDSQSAVVGQDLPVYASDDQAGTWRSLSTVKAPAYASSDPAYAKYTSAWTNAYLYVLPQDVGTLRAGTVMLAVVVSGDDEYAKEQKAADPNWRPTGDGDRRDLAIALYSSADEGATWSFNNIIATGGWQGGSAGYIGRTAAANTTKQVDPVWEPHLVARDGVLVAYYSDENDYLGYDSTTGVPVLDPDNATAPDSHGQILVHKTWDGRSAGWSQPVVDVAGQTVDRGNGKVEIGGGRPGMTTIAPTTDGRWMLTFEYFGGGSNTRYKIADDPLRFFADGDIDGDEIGRLPIPSGQRPLATGGSPVLATFPDGRIIYNAAGSGSVWVNESGRSDGQWKEFQTTLPGGYSRNLQYLAGTGRLLILQAAWAGGSVGPVKYAEVDLGLTKRPYSTIVNRSTGQALSAVAGKTQDANLTGDVPDIITRDLASADAQQRWNLESKGSAVTLLNKAGGRSLAIWTGTPSAGQRAAQWIDDGATDKRWTLVSSTDGRQKLRSVKDPSYYLTATGKDGAVELRPLIDASQNPAADDAQEWTVSAEANTAARPASLSGTASGRCLDVPNGAVGVQVQIWDCVGNANQQITFTAANELRVGDRCLAAENNGLAPGTKVILWACNGTNSQKWSTRLDGSVINRLNGLALDVTNRATANGSPVQLWRAIGTSNQTWTRI